MTESSAAPAPTPPPSRRNVELEARYDIPSDLVSAWAAATSALHARHAEATAALEAREPKFEWIDPVGIALDPKHKPRQNAEEVGAVIDIVTSVKDLIEGIVGDFNKLSAEVKQDNLVRKL